MADLSVRLADLPLPHPLLVASGCGGAGPELAVFVDPADLAGFVTRSLSRDTRPTGAVSSLRETPAGVLSARAPAAAGVDGFLVTELPWLAQRQVRTIASLRAATLEEYGELARRVGGAPGVAALEVHLADAAYDPTRTATIVRVVRREAPRGVAVLPKLALDVTSVVEVAVAAVDAGADGLVVADGPRGMAIDVDVLRPVSADAARLSGPAIHPLAVRCVWDIHEALPHVPIVGVGGVRTGRDALELVLAGATAVQVGSVLLQDPSAVVRVRDELAGELARLGFARLVDAVGAAHRQDSGRLDSRHGGGVR